MELSRTPSRVGWMGVSLVVLVSHGSAYATEQSDAEATVGWGELSDELVLDQRLQAAHLAAKRWHWTWGTLFMASGASQVLLTTFAHDDRDGRLAQGMRIVPPVLGTITLAALHGIGGCPDA